MSSLLGSMASSIEKSGREFFDLCKAIGESKSKQEEDRIIAEEIIYLKKVLPMSNTSPKKLKELVVRSLYVEMLGQDASFAYMRIVELCASSNISFKKAGYLAASLVLSPDHEFRFMLVNRMQQDMKSTNMIESTTALLGVCRLVTEDMVPAVIGEVIKLLSHDMDPVRKKAVSALHRLYQLDKSSVIDHYPKIRRIICDKDPSVMGASLGLILDLAKDDASQWKDLVPSLVSILKQVIEHRLSKDFDYHRIPAPWLQMNLLRLLAVLGRGDQSCSEDMYEVLAEVMQRADTGINVGYAIVYEAVNTVTTIYPNTVLLDTAATSISRFIRSDSHNLKYIGIKGLAAIVKEHPRYAADHQMAVVDCLEDPDETLKRKTLSLLFRMTNSVNVEFIIKKLLFSLENASDDHFRTDLVGQITQCAERYAPSNAWFIRTMIRVFELAGDKVNQQMAQTLIQLIAEGSDESGTDDEPDDDDLRAEAVGDFLSLINKPKLPDLLTQTMCWVLGEYGYLSRSDSTETIVDSLCQLMVTCEDAVTKGCVVTAIMKLVAQMGTCPAKALVMIQTYASSVNVDVSKRCAEFLKLLQHPHVMVDVLPVDASCEDIEVDEQMQFLNSYVGNALSLGAAQYNPPASLGEDEDVAMSVGLNITPYEMPTVPQHLGGLSALMGQNPQDTQAGSGPASPNSLPTSPNARGQNNALLSAAGARGGGGPWSRQMEAPKAVKMALTPMQQMEQQKQAQAEEQERIRAAQQQMQNAQAAIHNNSNSVNSPTNAAQTAEAPREPTEKERMAAALFGGFGAPASSSSASTRRTRAVVSASPPVVVAAVSSAPADDLLGMSSGDGSGTNNAAGNAGLFDMDDLSLLGGDGAGGSGSGPPPVPSDDGDMFGGMTLTAPAAAAAGTGSVAQHMTTPEFGAKWGGTPEENKGYIQSCGPSTLPELQMALERTLCYAHVESIGATNEAIFAAKAVDGNTMLVHIKLQNGGADVTVRSMDMGISVKEVNYLSSVLSR